MTTEPLDTPVDEDVLCPLCGYNLRGLPAPRCPECGAVFSWDELRDPTKRLHPYLFEHHPEQNVRSFLRTLLGGLLPRRFWGKLLPVQPSRPRRLVTYWVIFLILSVIGSVVIYGVQCWQVYQGHVQWRTNFAIFVGLKPPNQAQAIVQRTATTQEINEIVNRYGSVEAFLDNLAPMPPSLNFFIAALGNDKQYSGGRWAIWEGNALLPSSAVHFMVAALWPWAAMGVMLIFRASMKRAAVRPTHLLRVTIYSCDLAVWIGLLWAAIAMAYTIHSNMNVRAPFAVRLRDTLEISVGVLSMLAILVLTYRLGVAMGKYLRFRHAMAMAVSVQIILFLLFLVGVQMYYELTH